jgi:hypothetical protein
MFLTTTGEDMKYDAHVQSCDTLAAEIADQCWTEREDYFPDGDSLTALSNITDPNFGRFPRLPDSVYFVAEDLLLDKEMEESARLMRLHLVHP